MANYTYENIKNFCNRVINLERTHSKEIRLTREEAVSIMCELNQLLIKDSTKFQVSTINAPRVVSSGPVVAGTFKD